MSNIVEPETLDTENSKLRLTAEIRGISVSEYSYVQPAEKPAPGVGLRFGFEIGFSFPESLDNIIVRVKVIANVVQPSEDGTPLMVIATTTRFSVEGLSAFVQGDEIFLPSDFLLRLGNAAVGTTRGLLIAKNIGTPFEQALIPLLDDADLADPGTMMRFKIEARD